MEKVENVSLSTEPSEFAGLVSFAVEHGVRLVVPGPEKPLTDGIKDYFVEHAPGHIAVFGPSQAAAKLEASKAFAKDFMKRHDIPTAKYESFTDFEAARAFLVANKDTSWVLKADGTTHNELG